MNAYRISVWRSVRHNGKFSHTVIREELIHARNETEARGKIALAPTREWASGTLTIVASSEFIYSARKIGTVRKQLFYVYSDGSSPRPVSGRGK